MYTITLKAINGRQEIIAQNKKIGKLREQYNTYMDKRPLFYTVLQDITIKTRGTIAESVVSRLVMTKEKG